MTTTPNTPNDSEEDPDLNEPEAPDDPDATEDGLPEPSEPEEDLSTALSEG